MLISVIVAFTGIGVAYLFYMKRPDLPVALASRFRAVYTLLLNKYYVDEIYNALVVQPIFHLSNSFLWKVFDVKLVDGMVNGVARVVENTAQRLRRTQTGLVQNYALGFLIGVVLIVGYYLVK